MRPAATLALLFLAVAVFAQQPDPKPSIDEESPNYTYAGTYASMSSVDWRNFKMVDWEEGEGLDTYQLRDGKYLRNKPDNTQEATLASADTFKDGGRDFAVLIWSEKSCTKKDCSGSGLVQVVELQGKKLIMRYQLLYLANDPSAGASFDAKTRALTVRATNGRVGTVPAFSDILSYRWTGSSFAQTGRKTVPLPKK